MLNKKIKSEYIAVRCFAGAVFGAMGAGVMGLLLNNVYMLIGSASVLFLALLMVPCRGLFKRFSCLMGWHCYARQRISVTGADSVENGGTGFLTYSKCPWCGFEGMEDSQGNLF